MRKFQKFEQEPPTLNPQAPVAQKNADEVVFRRFQGEGAENTDFSPFRFHFSVGFISRSFFESDDLIASSDE